jgi:L-threonylcarbamoyladenylate synthase
MVKAPPGATPEVRGAAQALAAGALVAFPTETVYGLGARADDDAAVGRIFSTKGRPAQHPLIVHVACAEHARFFCAQLPETAQRLMAAFWPGPLTLIVPRASGVAGAAAGQQDSIGLRCPSHPVAQSLLWEAHALGVPGVAAPSANRFGRVSPTTAEHVHREFPSGSQPHGDVLVLDGGPCTVGIESTIIDCTRHPPALLRPGMALTHEIESVLGLSLGQRDATSPRASGTLEAHYAPQARVSILPTAALREQLAQHKGHGVGVYSRQVQPSPDTAFHWRAMPNTAPAAAQALFADLRAFDDQGMIQVWVEQVPEDAAWDGIRDRLQRAAAAG